MANGRNKVHVFLAPVPGATEYIHNFQVDLVP